MVYHCDTISTDVHSDGTFDVAMDLGPATIEKAREIRRLDVRMCLECVKRVFGDENVVGM